MTSPSDRSSDREAITEVIHQYIAGMENRQAGNVAACFSDDAVIDYGFNVVRGRAEIDEHFRPKSQSGSGIAMFGIDRLSSTMQLLPTIRITFDGDDAEVVSEGMSTHAGWRGDQAVVIMRSLYYKDQFRRINGKWLIRSRVRTPGWQVEMPAQQIYDPDQPDSRLF